MTSNFIRPRLTIPAVTLVTYASDSFDRANSAIALGTADVGGTWAEPSGFWGILTNKAYIQTPSVDNHNNAVLNVGQSNVSVSADIILSSTNNRAAAGLRLRHQDDSNFIAVYLYKCTAVTNSILIVQAVGGSATYPGEFTSAGLANGSTYTLKVTLSGSTITVLLNGVQKLSTTFDNTNLTTGKYGIGAYVGSTDFDDGGSTFNNFAVTN